VHQPPVPAKAPAVGLAAHPLVEEVEELQLEVTIPAAGVEQLPKQLLPQEGRVQDAEEALEHHQGQVVLVMGREVEVPGRVAFAASVGRIQLPEGEVPVGAAAHRHLEVLHGRAAVLRVLGPVVMALDPAEVQPDLPKVRGQQKILVLDTQQRRVHPPPATQFCSPLEGMC